MPIRKLHLDTSIPFMHSLLKGERMFLFAGSGECGLYCESLRAGRLGVLTPVGARGFPFPSTAPSFLDNGFRVSFPERKTVLAWALTNHPPLAPRLRMGRAIYLIPHCAWIWMLRDVLMFSFTASMIMMSNIMQQCSVASTYKIGRSIVVGSIFLPRCHIKHLIV